MKDRLFIEATNTYGIKKFINVDNIVRISEDDDNGGIAEISLTNDTYIIINENYEDFKKRLIDLIQYGMPNDRNLDNTL